MLERCPPGWDEEFAGIYEQNIGRLVRWLTAVFGSRDAEDIAQEALIRLYQRPTLLDARDPWPWLLVVARNVGRDMARRNARNQPLDPDVLNDLAEGSVHETMLARDTLTLRHALDRISAQDRMLILLHDLKGRSVGAIAEMLDMKPNAVNQRLFRARRRLAAAIGELHGGAVVVDEPQPPAVERATEQRRGLPDGRHARSTATPAETEQVACICGRPSCRATSPLAALRPMTLLASERSA